MDTLSVHDIASVGDAYMVCSGLPQPDVNHAINVANFALIVQSVVGIVTSPLDDTVNIRFRCLHDID